MADSREFKDLRLSADFVRKKEDIFDVDDLDPSHLTDKRMDELRKMLRGYQSIWDGHFGEINIT